MHSRVIWSPSVREAPERKAEWKGGAEQALKEFFERPPHAIGHIQFTIEMIGPATGEPRTLYSRATPARQEGRGLLAVNLRVAKDKEAVGTIAIDSLSQAAISNLIANGPYPSVEATPQTSQRVHPNPTGRDVQRVVEEASALLHTVQEEGSFPFRAAEVISALEEVPDSPAAVARLGEKLLESRKRAERRLANAKADEEACHSAVSDLEEKLAVAKAEEAQAVAKTKAAETLLSEHVLPPETIAKIREGLNTLVSDLGG